MRKGEKERRKVGKRDRRGGREGNNENKVLIFFR